jgi:predicted RNase H-like nuclease (RuvC/YqgF family)
MKVSKHVEQLLRQGKKPKELVELGFPKSVVTRVHRQLREEKAALQPKTPKGRAEAKSRFQPSLTVPVEMAPIQQKMASLESEIRELEARVEALEAIGTELEDIEDRLDETPAVGLRHRFKCDCGASGLVALHIQCTKCGRESWWGWSPKQ